MKNSTKKGWVRLHRQIEDNPLYFLEPFSKGQAWIDLFLNANHKNGIMSIRGNIIPIKRGQIGWSELTMSKRWTWSKNKVRRFLKLLETEQQIEQQKSTITTVITILNYEIYQSDDTTDDKTERQQKDSRRYTNKNDKNEKNVKKNTLSADADGIKQVFDLFYQSINPDINFGNKTSRKSAEDLIKRLGLEKTLEMTQYAISIQNKEFTPVITTPYQLKEKFTRLEIYKQKQEIVLTPEQEALELIKKHGKEQAQFPFETKYGMKALKEYYYLFKN